MADETLDRFENACKPSDGPGNRRPAQAEISALVQAFNGGQLAEAEKLAARLTRLYPNLALGWKAIGAVLKLTGRDDEALAAMQRSIELAPDDAEAHCNLGNALQDLHRPEEAEASCRKAIELKPDYAEAHNNLGNALRDLGRHAEAEASYQEALDLKPSLAEAHSNLGNTLKDLGQYEKAETRYRQAIALKPSLVEAHINLALVLRELGRAADAGAIYEQARVLKPGLPKTHCALGNMLLELGRLSEAEAAFQRALKLNPDYAEAYTNLGTVLSGLGRHNEAETSHRRAVELVPDFAEAHSNLGYLLMEQGRVDEAESCFRRAYDLNPLLVATKIGYAECISKTRPRHADDHLCEVTAQALSEAWIPPSKLSKAACELLKLRLSPRDNTTAAALEQLHSDPLVNSLLTSALICDESMEQFLTTVRRLLLEQVSHQKNVERFFGPRVEFLGSVAQQCFINEYVYFQTPDESHAANELRTTLTGALRNGREISEIAIIAVACYFPLHSITEADRLLQRRWSDAVTRLLAQQIREPLRERQLRISIPRLTAIDDEVSEKVRDQYEENPYPRWVKVPPKNRRASVAYYLRRRFPRAPIVQADNQKLSEILIAGCGTGIHSITTAQNFPEAKLLAIDLSMASLSHAKRKTEELGINSIEYANADILALGSLGRSFDVIESSGVLHHLGKPFDGWLILLSLLRRFGFMKLGFYSEIARRHVVGLQTRARQHGYDPTPEGIRECRQYLRQNSPPEEFKSATRISDFYSTSTCRDLIFHVQEHRLTLDVIAPFLRDNNLAFLGFEIDSSVLRAYQKRFPDDLAASNLQQWRIFENENPDTFIGMYQFWIQKL